MAAQRTGGRDAGGIEFQRLARQAGGIGLELDGGILALGNRSVSIETLDAVPTWHSKRAALELEGQRRTRERPLGRAGGLQRAGHGQAERRQLAPVEVEGEPIARSTQSSAHRQAVATQRQLRVAILDVIGSEREAAVSAQWLVTEAAVVDRILDRRDPLRTKLTASGEGSVDDSRWEVAELRRIEAFQRP